MRLCLATLHPRVLSGQIDSLVGLGRVLRRRGQHVTFVAPFNTAQLLVDSLVSLDRGPHRLSVAAARMLRTVPRIVVAAQSADVLHLALPTPAFSPVADVVQVFTRTPVLVGFEGHLAAASDVLRWQRLRRSWRTSLPLWGVNNGLVGRLSAYRCPSYLVSSAYQRQELQRLGAPGDRIHVLPNVVEAGKLAKCAPDAARAKFGLRSGLPIVGYIGHFNDVKGADVLATAFAALSRTHSTAHLALAWSGQGDPTPIRRALAPVANRVSWLGSVHVGRFLCAIDVLALPYRHTAGQGAFPSLVLEALHAGCPLVTSRLPLLEAVVEDGRTALLCPPERADLLADRLAYLLDNLAVRHAMSVEQRICARERFAPDVLGAQYEALYMSLAPAVGHTVRQAA